MKKFLTALVLTSIFIPTTFAAQTSYENGYYSAKVTANIRAQAGMQGKKIGYIAANEQLYVRGQKGQWCNVEYRTYEQAYVLCSLLEATPADESNPEDNYDANDYPHLPSDDWSDNVNTNIIPVSCDPNATTCSADFKVGITANLQNSDPAESFHTFNLNLHGQGRINTKDASHPEASLSMNGSLSTELGSGQGNAEVVMTDKTYIRLNDLKLLGIPDMPANFDNEVQKYLGQWFVLPEGNSHLLPSARMFMPMHGAASSDWIDSVIAISKYIGQEHNDSNVRYHYQVQIDDQKIEQLLDSNHSMAAMAPAMTNNSKAMINFWLDSNHRLVSANIDLTIVPTADDTVTGTVSINFDSSNLNQDIHVTVPEQAKPLPNDLRAEDPSMFF